ncbi:MAG: DJ-1/PfpI family protein [Campylobacteraceae bacterium]|jgi:4-methyl-5(b-hydroxyethyl)-thiazole monophosphate biosynthesis|nr:DJ-1/PfpI family protein [Campylobacteraceae bacterium]
MSGILIPLADGFEEIEAITIADVLSRGGLNVVTAAILKKEVIGAHGIKVVADMLLDDVESFDFDAIVLPGGSPGYQNLAKSEKLLALLKDFDEANKLVGAICAAPYVLAKAKVLKNSYTCYPPMKSEIKKPGYVDNKNVVIDDNIFTSKGPATAIEFALELLKKLKSDEISQSVRESLLA